MKCLVVVGRLLPCQHADETLILQVNTHVLTGSDLSVTTSRFQDDSHGISCRIKVLPPGECTRSVCPAPMQQCPPVPDP